MRSMSQTNRYRPIKREFTVWLIWVTDPEWKMYWCPDCRQPIIQYKGDLIMEHPGIDGSMLDIQPTTPPLMVQCKNAGCGRKIMFQGVAKREEI